MAQQSEVVLRRAESPAEHIDKLARGFGPLPVLAGNAGARAPQQRYLPDRLGGRAVGIAALEAERVVGQADLENLAVPVHQDARQPHRAFNDLVDVLGGDRPSKRSSSCALSAREVRAFPDRPGRTGEPASCGAGRRDLSGLRPGALFFADGLVSAASQTPSRAELRPGRQSESGPLRGEIGKTTYTGHISGPDWFERIALSALWSGVRDTGFQLVEKDHGMLSVPVRPRGFGRLGFAVHAASAAVLHEPLPADSTEVLQRHAADQKPRHNHMPGREILDTGPARRWSPFACGGRLEAALFRNAYRCPELSL